jgi:hypothetical protein
LSIGNYHIQALKRKELILEIVVISNSIAANLRRIGIKDGKEDDWCVENEVFVEEIHSQ